MATRKVTEATVDVFLAANDYAVLFFAGDADRIADTNDVAVILPELMKVFGEALTPALVARESERAFQLRYRFNAFPTLVFLRDAGDLGAVSKVKGWSVYLTENAELLAKQPSVPPPYKFPDGCLGAGATR